MAPRKKAVPRFGKPFLEARNRMRIEVDWHHLAQRGRQLFDQADDIELTARRGTIDWESSEHKPDNPYDKFLVHRYFGKQNRTLEVVLLYNPRKGLAQVMTVWVLPGRRSRRRPQPQTRT